LQDPLHVIRQHEVFERILDGFGFEVRKGEAAAFEPLTGPGDLKGAEAGIVGPFGVFG
jgi:hypothetical protein